MPQRSTASKVLRTIRKSASAKSRKRKFDVRIHLTIAGLAICALAVLGVFDRNTFSTQPTKAETVTVREINIEHAGPSTMTMVMARKGSTGYLSLENTSASPLKITLPENWRRSEVSKSPLSAFMSEKLNDNTVRWTIPAGAGMKMFTTDVPTSLHFTSPSDGTVSITIHSLDLLTNVHNVNVVLLQQAALYDRLWSVKE